MNELVSHIEFLLHDHNCVIIPGFGGFVVNSTPARRDGIATFHPPSSELVFNRYLTHNDGLLAQSFMKSDAVPFEAAMQKIEYAVQELLRALREEKRVEMGRLGLFETNNDKQFVYKPTPYVQPAFFGLGTATLKPLIQMQPSTAVARGEQHSPRSRTIGITAAAAAILLLLMFLLPVGDRSIERQAAQLISENDLFGNRPRQHNSTAASDAFVATDAPAVETSVTDATDLVTGAPFDEQESSVTEVNQTRYYIIVGVYEVKEVAERMMEDLLEGGFAQRGWLERPERIDVYAVSFAERKDAESTLRMIHKEHPAYRDAWILKR